MSHECDRCGDEYEVGVGGDPFTHVSVSYHHQAHEDFAASFCPDCAAYLLTDLRVAIDAYELDMEAAQ